MAAARQASCSKGSQQNLIFRRAHQEGCHPQRHMQVSPLTLSLMNRPLHLAQCDMPERWKGLLNTRCGSSRTPVCVEVKHKMFKL